MARTITVKGIGKVSAKPDWVVLSMAMTSSDLDYGTAMAGAERNISDLNERLMSAGFEKDDLKTTNFDVSIKNEFCRDENDHFISVFKGYAVSHDLKLSFGFDMKRLAVALSTISSCESHPKVSIAFTVKDPSAISEEMLRSAAQNAKANAALLTDASGVHLGQLLRIDYNWGEMNIFSHTRYEVDDSCMDAIPPMASCQETIDINPDDIDLSDTATFTWEIL